MASHQLFGGKLHLYKRPDSRFWQCSTYWDGKNWRESTGKDSLAEAQDFAEDWYLNLRGKVRSGDLKTGKSFAFVAEVFMREYEVITQGQRNAQYVQGHRRRLKLYLLPFFGKMPVNQITAGTAAEYRMDRIQKSPEGEPPARSTIHQEIVVLRQVLKTAERHQWLTAVPNLSPPYKASGKITHRAWFSPAEYRQLYQATRRRAKNPPRPRWQRECEQMHDWVLFMANTGLRPDEAARLEYRDVTIVKDRDSGETILEIEVRGKRGVGHCKSTTGAVRPFTRLRKRNNGQPTDRLFPSSQHELFNAILTEEGLKIDRDGNRRTAYSLRHTYVCLRLMEGADVYQIAKNCRTSVEMIEKHYAVHLKNTLDASAINVRRGKRLNASPRQSKAKRKSRLAKDTD